MTTAAAPLLDPASPPPLGKRAARGAAWIGLSFGVTRVVSLVNSVVLARLLVPADFGIVAMASLMLAFVGPFQDSGLEQAFIAKTDRVREAAATIAWTTPVTGVLVYVVAAASAPLVAWLFRTPAVVPVVHVLALNFVLRGLAIAPMGILSKELAFRAKAMVAIASAVADLGVGVGLALAGAGYWSLVGAQLAATAVAGAAAWVLAPWRPRGRFSFARLREMAPFGRHMVAGNFLGFLGSYLDNITVGRTLGSEALGLYGVAFKWGQLPPQALSATVTQVAFPSFVAVRGDAGRFRAAYLRVVRTVSSISLPASLGLWVIAPALIHTLYPARWNGMIAPLRIFAFFGLVNAIVGTTGDVFKAANRPGWIPGLAIVHFPVLVLALWLLIGYGPSGAATALLLAALASGSVAIPAALHLLGVSLGDFLATLAPQAIAAVAMAGVLHVVARALADAPAAVTLVTLAVAGVATYAVALFLCGRDTFEALVTTVRDALPARPRSATRAV